MKKFLSVIFIFLYFLSANSCFAYGELYYLKNADKNIISSQVENILTAQKYTFKSKNPFYAVSNKKSEDYAVVVLQTSGEDLFYYYEANDSNKKLKKLFLKNFKEQNIKYEQSTNTAYLSNFAQTAQKAITGQKKTYSFDEPKVSETKTLNFKPLSSPTTLKGFIGKVAKGAAFDVYLQNSINTATAKAGDEIVAVLKTDWTYNNNVVAPQGSLLYGSLTKANHAAIGMRNGSVQIEFNKLVTPNGKTYNLVTQKIDFNVTNEGSVQSTVVDIASAAVIGGLIGLAICAISSSSSNNYGKNAAIGGGIGGTAMLAKTVMERGVDAEIPSFTDLNIVLDKPLDVVFSY